MARRRASASPPLKPAATMASLMTCSWKIGTPRVALEHLANLVVGVVDRLQTLPPAQVGMHHVALDRPRAHDRHLHHQIVETGRFQARQHGHLRPRLDLEDAHGVALLEHLVGFRSSGGTSADAEVLVRKRATRSQRLADRGQHAEREHVDLEQAERLEIVLVPLDHRPVRHGGVLDRHELGEGAFGR